ncbi:hypothetical protein MMC25_000430 [Agyrium rufum]|nr:hypothetical protein [Agyrium rufum]
MSAQDEHEVEDGITQVVRQFSIDSAREEPDSQLAISLDNFTNEQQERQKINDAKKFRHLYEDDSDDGLSESSIINIDNEHALLQKAWEDFLQILQTEEKEQEDKKHRFSIKRFSSKKPTKVVVADRPPKPTTTALKKESSEPLSKQWQQKAQGTTGTVSFEDIVKVVEQAESNYKGKDETRHGKAQKHFHSFCKTLEGHSNMLQIIPSQNNYASIFCGTITTIVSASVNHEKIAEGFGKALEEISYHYKKAAGDLQLHNTAAMRQEIGILYANIFKFLRGALNWFRKKWTARTWHSLNEDFYRDYEDQIQRIKELSALIFQIKSSHTQAEVRDIRLLLERMSLEHARGRREMREDNQRILEAFSTMIAEIAPLKQMILGHKVNASLRYSTKSWTLEDSRAIEDVGSSENDTPKVPQKQIKTRMRLKAGPQANSTPGTYSRTSLQLWSRHLETHTTSPTALLSSIIDSPNRDLSETPLTDPSIAHQLHLWSQARRSYGLWITGTPHPSTPTFPTPTSLIAAKVTNTAASLGISVLCYFCQLPPDLLFPDVDPDSKDYSSDISTSDNEVSEPEIEHPPTLHQSRQEAAVIDLLYTLIRQLISILPKRVPATPKLSQAKFAKLDGSPESYRTGLSILTELLNYIPSTLLIVIDGIEQLDEWVEDPVCEILGVLQGSVERAGEGREKEKEGKNDKIVKILYTTSGPSEILERVRSDHHRGLDAVEASRVNAFRAGGLARKMPVLLGFDRDGEHDGGS